MITKRSAAAIVAAVLLVAGCGSDSDESGSADTDTDTDLTDTELTDTVATESDDAEGTSAVDCPPPDGTESPTRDFESPPPECLEAGASYQAIVETNMGEFTIDIDPTTAPVAANNFVFLARNQYFDDTVCHRIIPNFVVQCGDPTATGTGGPGYTIVDEPPTVPYQIGSIAMAKRQTPDSAGSQFFIITGSDGAALPPLYALFGEVVDGFDTTVAEMAATGTPSGDPSEPVEIRSIRIVQS